MSEQQIVDEFLEGKITAEQMVERLAAEARAARPVVDVREDVVPASLVRAQAAIRRINRGR